MESPPPAHPPSKIDRIENSLNDRYRKIESYKNSPILRNPEKIIENCELYLDILNSRINESYKDMLASYTSSFFSLYSKLDSLSPLKVLSRGYSIVKKNNDVLTDVNQINIGDVVSIQLKNGIANAIPFFINLFFILVLFLFLYGGS